MQSRPMQSRCTTGRYAARPSGPAVAVRRNFVRGRCTTLQTLPDNAIELEAKQLVDKVLARIKNTDGGMMLAESEKAEIDVMLERLEVIGDAQQPRPMSNPLLFGNCNVAYTSVRRGGGQQGEPAGGRFRNPLGRTLFRTAGLYQSVLRPDIATNKVRFRLLGFIPGAIGLRGKVVPENGSEDTVKVLFERPVLSLPGDIHLSIGPPSSVTLKTTYLDDRVRLAKGGRGSLFVFTRGGEADTVGMDKVGIEGTTPGGNAILAAFVGALMAGGYALWQTGHPAAQLSAPMIWLLGLLIAFVTRKGGLIEPDDWEAKKDAKTAPPPATA